MTTYTTRRAHPRRWRLALLPALILGTLATLSTVLAPAATAADGSGSRTVTQRHTEWQVSGPLTALAIGIAVQAIALIVGSFVVERRGRRRNRTTAAS